MVSSFFFIFNETQTESTFKMKKTYLFAALFGFAAMANAQTAAPAGTPTVGKGGVKVSKPTPHLLEKKNSANRSVGTSRWYNYGETMDAYWNLNAGTNSMLYGNNLFPDTTILVDYGTSGYSGPWIHNLGDVLDVSSAYFNDASIHPGELFLNNTTPYRVDSVGILFIYDRAMSNPAIVDTLIIEVGVNGNNTVQPTYSFGSTSQVSINLGTDTTMFKAIKYTQASNSMNYTGKKVYKIALDEAFYADSTADGLHYAEVSTADLPNVQAGKVVTMSARFKPGYTWIANYDTLENKNSMFFLTYKEQDQAFPLYTKRDYNASYIIPQDVRYNAAGTWNGLFIPSFAYMGGATATYSYEHHLFYYKVNSVLIGVNNTADNNTTLHQNEPNPFSKTTTIRYTLDKSENVSLSIIDVTGRVVKTITESNVGAGNHSLVIDGSEFNKGVYFYTLKTGGKSFTKRMVIAD